MTRRFINLILLIIFGCVYFTDATAGSKAESFYKKGMNFKKEYLEDQALSEFNKAIQADTNYADAYAKIGDILWHNGGFEKYAIAEQKYSLAIAKNPTDGGLYLKRAGMRSHGGRQDCYTDLDTAVILLTNSISRSPKDAELYYQRGCANSLYIAYIGEIKREGGGDLPGSKSDPNIAEAAKNDLLKAVELNPKYVDAFYQLCFFYGGNVRRDQDSIIWASSKIIQIDGKELDAYMRRGSAYKNKKDNDRAIADYSFVIQTNPKYSHAYSSRSDCYKAKGDLNSAIADYGKMIELDPSNKYYYFQRAGFYREQKKFPEALSDVNTAIEKNPGSSRAYSERALCYKDMKEYDKAIEDYGKAAELLGKPGSEFKGETPDPYGGRAEIYRLKGDYDNSIKDWTNAIEIYGWTGGGLAWRYRQRGYTYKLKNDFENAIRDYSLWIEIRPQDADGFNMRADAYMNWGKLDSALTDVNKALEIDPGHYYANITKGEILTRKKDYYAALDAISAAVKIHPDWAGAFYYRALTYKAKGDRWNAMKDLKKCIEFGGFNDAQDILNEMEKQ